MGNTQGRILKGAGAKGKAIAIATIATTTTQSDEILNNQVTNNQLINEGTNNGTSSGITDDNNTGILLNQISKTNRVVSANDATLHWSSTGGGWRSMFACMGFANLFQQSSLLSLDQPSPLKAIATISGSSWFSSQFYYSPEFYNATVNSTPDELYDFVTDWMDSYKTLAASAPEYDACEKLYEVANDNNTKALCNMAFQYEGSWADFIKDMLDSAAVGFGDEGFVSRIMDSETRVGPLKGTDLWMGTALTPTARGSFGNMSVYLGPDDSDELYTVMIPASYVVQDSFVGYWYGVPSSPKAHSSNANLSQFSLSDWEDYNLFPQNGTATIPNTRNTKEANFKGPFGGGATQPAGPAAASSALLGYYSSLLPSAYAQTMSVIEYESITNNPNLTAAQKVARRTVFNKAIGELYNSKLFYNFAVCSQWPDPCGKNDGFFLDGLAMDDTSLPMIIGNYHNSPNADLTKPMKIILTNTNAYWNPTFNHVQVLMHYKTSFNENVQPGSFIWLPYYNKQPIHSPQIFKEYMNGYVLEQSLQPITNSTMTTAILKGTTISNPAFSVKEGQSVEILLINLNYDIPTIIASADLIEELTDPMATMTRDVAMNEELLARVQAFVLVEANIDAQISQISGTCSHGLSYSIIILSLCTTCVFLFQI